VSVSIVTDDDMAVSKTPRVGVIFDLAVKINATYHRNVHIHFFHIRQISCEFVIQQDKAPAQGACETISLLRPTSALISSVT